MQIRDSPSKMRLEVSMLTTILTLRPVFDAIEEDGPQFAVHISAGAQLLVDDNSCNFLPD